MRLYNQNIEAWLHAITDEARDSDAILASGLAMYVGAAAGLELRKPWIGVWVLPITPTREFSMPMAPPMRLPGWANRLTFRALHGMTWHKFGKSTNAARENLFGGPTRARIKLDCPILYGISRHLVARPADWPDTHQICGQWTLPPPSDWQPPDKLREFLGAGAAPIYVGFGSPSCFIRQKHLDVLIEGIAGRRAVFYPGWSQIDATMLPKNFFVVRETPHTWLFPQCSVIIHHGGAGTTHTSARAGVPSIVTPFAADQFFWASRLAAAGVAPKYVRRSALDAQSLAAMIEFSQQDEVRTCAKRLSEAMSQENGVGDAVRRIEMLMSRQ
jgi:UDP:flavonoid glycosyltransferase YjiC (YdhE family)